MRICDMEGRTDWKNIVESVVCPRCDAPSGIPCRNLSASYGTLYAQEPRNDWHQERKQLAVQKYDEAFEQVRKESQNAVEEGSLQGNSIEEHQDGDESGQTAETSSGNSTERGSEEEVVTTLVPEQNIAIDEKNDDQ